MGMGGEGPLKLDSSGHLPTASREPGKAKFKLGEFKG